MHGRSEPSFSLMKKKPAPSGEEDGRIKPEASDSLMYFSIDSQLRPRQFIKAAGWERRPRQQVDPAVVGTVGRRLRVSAYCFLKTSSRSWYSLGIHNRSSCRRWLGWGERVRGTALNKGSVSGCFGFVCPVQLGAVAHEPGRPQNCGGSRGGNEV